MSTISHTAPQAFESKHTDLQTESLLKKVDRGWRAYTRCLKGSKDCSKHKTYIARALTGLAAVAPIAYGIHYTNPTFYQTLKTALSKNAAQSISFPSTSKSVGTVPDTIKNMIDTELTQNKTIDEMVTKYEFSEDDGAIRFLINPNYAVLDEKGDIVIDNDRNGLWKNDQHLEEFNNFMKKVQQKARLSHVSAYFDQTIPKKTEEKKESKLESELSSKYNSLKNKFQNNENQTIDAILGKNKNIYDMVIAYWPSRSKNRTVSFLVNKKYTKINNQGNMDWADSSKEESFDRFITEIQRKTSLNTSIIFDRSEPEIEEKKELAPKSLKKHKSLGDNLMPLKLLRIKIKGERLIDDIKDKYFKYIENIELKQEDLIVLVTCKKDTPKDIRKNITKLVKDSEFSIDIRCQ